MSCSVCFSFRTFFSVSRHISCPTMWFLLSSFVSFLKIFQVLQCAIFIFHFFSVSCHIPVHIGFGSHFPCFSVFSPKSRYYSRYFSIFHVFHCFLPYFRSYIVCFSFCKFFSDFPCNSCHSM